MRRLIVIGSLLLTTSIQGMAAQESSMDRIEQGVRHCRNGNYYLALEALQTAYRTSTAQEKSKAAGAIGRTYLQMRQLPQAEQFLKEAFDSVADPVDRARYAIDLANLEIGRGNIESAKNLYAEAGRLAPENPSIVASSRLNLARYSAKESLLLELKRIDQMLSSVKDGDERARYLLNLGNQAKSIGPAGLELAYQSYNAARELVSKTGNGRLEAEALDELAQLYEDSARVEEALRLSESGILAAQTTDAHDRLVKLEWRRGRLLRQLGKPGQAIAAFERAVEHIEAIRQDIPVEYQDGRSSFRDTLEPVYLGLADLLLQQSGSLPPKEQIDQLRRARNTVELIKQTELEDFLGDRCSVGTVRQTLREVPVPEKTAVLYPIILPDRLEILVETSSGMARKSISTNTNQLRADVLKFASALRSAQPYQQLSKKLYQLLLQPIEELVEREKTDTIVIVPDGVLRLLPFGALNDGQKFAIEKYAIAVVPGMTMTHLNSKASQKRDFKVLLAGLSEPGDVVEKLPQDMVMQMLALSEHQQGSGSRELITRALLTRSAGAGAGAVPRQTDVALPKDAERNAKLRKILALAGVKQEIETLGKLAPAQILIDDGFNVAAFSKQVMSGDFRVVHIASHGVFGGSADSTFIMAHDDLITIDRLQDFLRAAGQQDSPIDLLTLSACETAEGDDRAPLGLSGAALKARAGSSLGSLWPVSDNAAKTLMSEFYNNLLQDGGSKAKALQKAQIELIGERKFNHPFFWAPFVVVGNWL